MLSIDLTSFAEKWIYQVAMSRPFRVKEAMSSRMTSVTRLRMTNEDASREGAGKWKSEMKLLRVEDRTSPRAPMSESDGGLGVTGYGAIR
jgi:hypothetical protein